MRKLFLILALSLSFSSILTAKDCLINLKSPYSVNKTADRFEKIVKAKGMKVFIRIDHAKGALTVGKKLRPTQLIIFGNPKGGTALMLCKQTIGIDLPLKALVWQDKKGQVWLSYNKPKFLAKRHKIKKCAQVFIKIKKALSNFAKIATAN